MQAGTIAKWTWITPFVVWLVLVASMIVSGAAVFSLAAHGMGIARAFQVSEEAGAFAGVAMALTALASSILFPLLLWVFTR